MKVDKDFLDSQRLIGDTEADALIKSTFESNQQTTLYHLLCVDEKKIKSEPSSSLKKFLTTAKENPSWFDEEKLLRGRLVFKKYAQEMMTLLGAMALPYCYAASPGNKALYLSDKMRQATGKRLVETAAFVINVLTPHDQEEVGFDTIHINKVRIIHAISRYYLQKNSAWNSAWGTPINQEDMAGTNLAFSYIILLGMQQSGFMLAEKEKEDFLFAWRYIGYQLHIDEQLLPASFKEATLLTQKIKERNFRKSEEGVALTKELLDYFKTIVPEQQAAFIRSQIRFNLGNQIAEYIGLQPEPFKDRITSMINSFKSAQNYFSTPTSSYEKMISNHRVLRKQFVGH